MDAKYTSRERCIRAIKREEVDLIPLNIWIDAPEPLKSLMEHLDIKKYEKLMSHFNIDYAPIYYQNSPGLNMVNLDLKGGFKEERFKDEKGRILSRNRFGVVSAFSSDGRTSMYVDHPLQKIDVDDFPWPYVDEDGINKDLKLRKKYEDFCLMGFSLQAFETACALFGYNEMFKRMFLKDKSVEKALDKLFKITYTMAKLFLEAGVDEIYNGDDTGAEHTMLLSPEMWRKYLKPRYKKLSDLVHTKGAFLHFHSDGWIEPIIPDLIEIGVDVLEPLQPEAMNPKKIKQEYGDKISFEGAISIQRTLPFGTLEDVENEVKTRIKDLGPTGYILRPSHTILMGTPLENIIGIYEAAQKYRKVS